MAWEEFHTMYPDIVDDASDPLLVRLTSLELITRRKCTPLEAPYVSLILCVHFAIIDGQ